MTSVWNGRMAALQAAGVPAQISWSQGLLKRDAWGNPQGRQEQGQRHEVRRLLDHGNPAGARFPRYPLRLGQQRLERVHPDGAAAVLPSAPDIKSQLLSYNYDWWIDNREAVTNRFNKWLLS